MEFENIMKLIKAVSDSSLSGFTYVEGETKIVLEKASKSYAEVPVSGIMPVAAQTQVSLVQETKEDDSNKKIVKSPLVGTFYNASTPESDAFVKVGDTVKKGQTLGIVEAMKLMNEIECEFDGIVEEILVTNEQIVEYGQSMFVIR